MKKLLIQIVKMFVEFPFFKKADLIAIIKSSLLDSIFLNIQITW